MWPVVNPNLVLSTLNLCLGGLVFLLGLVILRENPGQRLNRIVALMLFFGGFGSVLAALALLARPGVTGKAATDALQNFSYVWEFFFPTLFVFASLFPEERAFTRRVFANLRFWAPSFTALVYLPHLFHFVLMLVVSVWRPHVTVPETGPLHYAAPLAGLANVVLGLFLLVHRALFSLVNLGFGLATMALLFDSLRKTRVPRLRQQLRVITIGLSACLVCYSLATSIPGLFNLELDGGLRSALTIAALTLGPGSIAYSVVRYKFLDARLLARRGILYALASAALVGLYLLVVGRVNKFVTSTYGMDSRVFEPVFLIMALALFQPVIARLEEVLDRMLLKDPNDYRNVLRQLGRDLQTTIDLEVLLQRTTRTIADALLLQSAHIVALTPEGPVIHTGAGDPIPPKVHDRLAGILHHVSAKQPSYRLTDRVEGLDLAEQEVLANDLRLAILVPLRWRNDLVGALMLGHKLTGTAFTSEDVTLVTSLASQVSVSLQNALLLRDRIQVVRFEEELNLARQIQSQSMLSEFPAMPRCEVHALTIPSKHVGGDFYDVVEAADGSHVIAIADVSGKGVPAALLTSMLQAALRTQAVDHASPGAILKNINSLLYRSTAIQQFATFFLARVNGERLRVTYSNAGHNWPVIVRATGERVFLDRGGTVLGILEDTPFEEGEVRLTPGDRLILYTDGISEAANEAREQFGEDRVCDLVQSLPPDLCARDIADKLLAELRDFLGDVEAQDDMTILVLRVLEPVAAPGRSAAEPVEAIAG